MRLAMRRPCRDHICSDCIVSLLKRDLQWGRHSRLDDRRRPNVEELEHGPNCKE